MRLLLIFIATTAIGVAINLGQSSILHRTHLGAEYYNIGLALADGRGYSDPFGEPTGPTAWMPPVYPILLAGLDVILGAKDRVALAIVVLMVISVAVSAAAVDKIARRIVKNIPAICGPSGYLLWTLVFYYWYYRLTSDVWLLTLVVTAFCTILDDFLATDKVKPLRWGLVAGVASLSSPTLAFAILGVSFCLLLMQRKHLKRWVSVAAIAASVSAPWIIRNAVTFHKFVPTKSNMMFEAYQANVVDRDGVYDLTTIMQHPINAISVRLAYSNLGEFAFVKAHGEQALRAVQRHPGQYLRCVYNRALAGTVSYVPLAPDMDEDYLITIQKVLFALPVPALICSIFLGRQDRRYLCVLAAFWLLYLLPYVAVAIYIRYLMPLAPVFVLFIILGFDRLYGLFRRRAVETDSSSR